MESPGTDGTAVGIPAPLGYLLAVLTGAANGWILALATVSLLIVYFIAVRHEEAYLEGTFGAEFTGHTRSVRRWL